jgi:hypothetical protein
MAKKKASKSGGKGGGKSGPVELIVMKPEQIEALQNNLKATSKHALKDTLDELDNYGQIFVQSAQRSINRDEGYTAGGLDYVIDAKGERAGELRIVWNKPANRPKDLIEWLLYGTGIYGPRKKPIVPKRPGGLLKFKTKDGKWHAKKSVKGMQPNNFLKEAWDNTQGVRRTLAQRVGKMIIRSIKDGRGKGKNNGGPAVPNRN